MAINNHTHFVFVDFENVQDVNLGLVERKPVRVTLLIGKNQTRLDLSLVQQIHRLAAQVELVEVGASGHNALDLTLACYLGRAIERVPAANFHIISKDKDFEPMIGHLRNQGIKVARHESFVALPMLSKPSKPVSGKTSAPFKPSPAPKSEPVAKASKADDKFQKLLTHLKLNHPKTEATLRRSIATFYGNKLAPTEVDKCLQSLRSRKFLSIDPAGKVSYL